MRRWILGSLFVLSACTPSPAPSSTSGTGAGSVEGEARSPAHTPNDEVEPDEKPPTPSDPSYEVVQQVCGGTCGGPWARVQVFRDGTGKVARLRLDGDLDVCSHPPRVYFDAEGSETLTIPFEPVEPGSERAKEFAASQAREIEGLQEAELLACTNPTFCEPERTEGFRSDFPCRSDSDCRTCECGPVSRDEWRKRAKTTECTIDGEECIATNPVCCGGRCMLSR